MSSRNPNAERKLKRKRSPSPTAETHKRQHFPDLFDDDSHGAQDKKVLERLKPINLPIPPVGDSLPPFAAFFIVYAVTGVAREADSLVSFIEKAEDITTVIQDEDFLKVIERCYRSNYFKEIRNHRTLVAYTIHTDSPDYCSF